MTPPSRVAAGLLLLAGAFLAGCVTAEQPQEAAPPFYARLDEGNALNPVAAAGLINAYRQKNGLAPLALDPGLSADALERAATVAANDTSSWGEMPTLTRTSGTGADRMERVSAGYRTLAEAFSGWRDSPPHNRLLLSPTATRLGIAAVDRPGTKYRVYWGLIVAGPRALRTKVDTGLVSTQCSKLLGSIIFPHSNGFHSKAG
jgi:uncharacterized protein YkwD